MSSFTLKILAIVTMLIDHIGLVFFPSNLIFRQIGRIAFPIFAFQLGIGFQHTKNKVKHIWSMLLFGILSQIPYILMLSTHKIKPGLNIGFTLAIGLLALYCITEIKPKTLKIISLIPILILTYALKIEYGIYGILLILIFYFVREKKPLLIAFTFLNTLAYQLLTGSEIALYSLIALIPLLLYNNKKGPGLKYLFYLFYPVHMLLLYLLY